MSKKRGQITLFIMLGVVLVILFSIFFYVINYSKESTIGLEVEETFGRDIKDINLFVETCFDSKVKSGLDLLGKQGGYIKFPENFLFLQTSQTNIPLHYNEGNEHLPSLEDMQNSLAGYINESVLDCLNDFLFFKEKGFEFSDTEMAIDVTISENAVNIQLNYPVSIKDNDNNIFKLPPFNKNTPMKLKKMHEFAEKAIDAIKDYDDVNYPEPYPDFVTNQQDYINILSSSGLFLNPPTATSFQLFLWQIIDPSGNEPVHFIFGTKSQKGLPH
tara:strand:+ start:1150 stop:1968 length:819 start_codon:yes stop_codon:yes gene_type:complete